MNFSAQIKRGITALVLCSAIAGFAVTHAATAENTTATQTTVAVVASTRIGAAARPLACDNNTRFTTRVHVGRPLRVSANPTPRQIARAAR
jgi:hypothetical protein